MDANTTDTSQIAGQLFQGEPVKALQHMMTFLYYGNSPDEALAFPLMDLDNFYTNQCIIAIHSSARISSAIVVLLLLFLVAQNYKSALFIIYQVNFVFMIIGSALELAWIMSFEGSITGYMTGVTGSLYGYNVSMAASVFQTLLMLSLLGTLVLQIHVAFSDQSRRRQWAVTVIAMLACFPAYFVVIWRLAAVGISLYGPRHGAGSFGFGYLSIVPSGSQRYLWAFRGAWRAFAASVSFLSLILCVKLYLVSRTRTKMGLMRFDPLRILFTMALQNSVIPSILAIISAGINSNNQGGQSISASAIPVCACMLPIGFIWAQYNMHVQVAPPPGGDLGRGRMHIDTEKSRDDIRDDYSELSTSRFGGRFEDLHPDNESMRK